MSEKEEDRFCSSCNTEIPAAAPAGLCPKCLLMSGTEDGEFGRAHVEDDLVTLPLGADLPSDFPLDREPADGDSLPLTETSPSASKGAAEFAPTKEKMGKLFPDLEILDLLGAGGMGAVYKARQKRLDRVIALKILACPPELHDSFSLRFEREAQLLAKLHHPNIVTLFDFGEIREDGPGGLPLFYFIMEYVDGSDLSKRIRSGSLTPDETLRIVPQICDALQVAHDAGITHRDVKPANMLLDSQGQVRVADFGVAKIVDHEDDNMTGLTLTGTTMGTPHYMAPEQWDSPEKVDHRSDIYSLGVIFYQMLTGDRPVGRFQTPSGKVAVDPRIDEVIYKALETSRRERYQKASEMAEDVREIVATPPPVSKRSGMGKLMAMALFAAALIGAGIWWSQDRGGVEGESRIAKQTAGRSQDEVARLGGNEKQSKSGKLRAAGTDLNGNPIDLSRAEKYDDFVEVSAEESIWIALRENGDTVSSNGSLDRSGIAKLARGSGSERGFIAMDGSVELTDHNGGLGGEALPESFAEIGVSDVALGKHHGIALLRNGQVETWGPRYERSIGEGETPPTFETEKWPEPPPASDLQNTIAIAAGVTHAAALHKDGSLTVWGHQGVVDPKFFEHIYPIREIRGCRDNFHLITQSKKVYRLRVPRSKHPDSPTGTEIKLEFVGKGEKLESNFYLDSGGNWQAFSLLDTADDLLPQVSTGKGIVVSGRTISLKNGTRSWLFWIEPPNASGRVENGTVPREQSLGNSRGQPGELRAMGTDKDGKPLDLSRAEKHEDFVDVVADRYHWVALRENGQTVSSDGKLDREGIAKLSVGTYGSMGFVGKNGAVEIWDRKGGLGGKALPESLGKIGVSELALGMGHGVALLRTGQIETWGPRYERNFKESGIAPTYESEKWPDPPSPSDLQNVTTVTASVTHAAALHRDGSVTIWGYKGVMDQKVLDHMDPIEDIKGFGDEFHLLTRSKKAYRLRVPRSKHPDSPTGNLYRLEFVAEAEKLASTFFLDLDGNWKSFSSNEDIGDLLSHAPSGQDLIISGDAVPHDDEMRSWLFWIEPANTPSSPVAHSEAFSKPGRLSAMGTLRNGDPIDLSRAEGIDDFVKVILQGLGWIGLRSDGTTVSSDSRNDRKNIVDIHRFGGNDFVVEKDGHSLEFLTRDDKDDSRFDRDVPKEVGEKGFQALSTNHRNSIALLSDGSIRVWGDVYDHPERQPDWISPRTAWPRPPAAATRDVVSIGTGSGFGGTVTADGKLWLWDHDGLVDLGEWEKLQGEFSYLRSSAYDHTDAVLKDGRILRLSVLTDTYTLSGDAEVISSIADTGYRPLYQKLEGEWFCSWPTDDGLDPYLKLIHGRAPEEFSMSVIFNGYKTKQAQTAVGLITIDSREASSSSEPSVSAPAAGIRVGEEQHSN